MNTPDSLDSLFAIYDNPSIDRETRSKIYLNLTALSGQLSQFIQTHDIADAEADLSRLIITLIGTNRSIKRYMTMLTQQKGAA